MKRWLRRLAIVLLLLVWASVMAFPIFAVLLATQNQLQVGEEQGRRLRLYLVQERAQEGIGIEWARPVAGTGDDAYCLQTSIRYLMWVGEGQNVTYCQCFTGDRSLQESNRGLCPPP